MLTPADLWAFLPLGYLSTILIEAPILLVGLSPRHTVVQRLVAGLWLTLCTYPIVVLVLPLLMLPQVSVDPSPAELEQYRAAYYIYLSVAETFAPAAECALFYFAYVQPREEVEHSSTARDMIVVTVANLASFLIGMWLRTPT